MQLNDFDYNLPKDLIAQYPLMERDTVRLLVVDRAKATFEHRYFREIADYLSQGDVLTLNDTKVLPSRLIGKRLSGGKAEILLLRQKPGLTFEALIKPARIRLKERLIFNEGKISCQVIAKNEVKFLARDAQEVYQLGAMPLPPYIKRPAQELDNTYYQTVYARHAGAIASPTAGLHFTEGLIRDLEGRGIKTAYLTLHVGYATFRPVKSQDIEQHKMEKENFHIPADSLKIISQAQKNKTRICAVGTTSCRALETFAASSLSSGDTDLFIYPGYKFKAVDMLLTNFHLPKTTLFMLVCAFAGDNLARRAYQEAIALKYRFYSYGDAMLII